MAGLSVLVVMGAAAPAMAKDPWGTVDCSQTPLPGCELGVGKGEPAAVVLGREADKHRPSAAEQAMAATGSTSTPIRI